MAKPDIEAEILKVVHEGKSTSFADLSRQVPGFDGEQAMFTSEFPNVILWPAVSAEGIAALGRLLERGTIFMKKASILVYHIDGKRPAFPIAARLQHYERVRWLPVVFTKTGPKKKTRVSSRAVWDTPVIDSSLRALQSLRLDRDEALGRAARLFVFRRRYADYRLRDLYRNAFQSH